MATVRIPNIDEDGRFLNPEVVARLREELTTLDGGPVVEDPNVPGTAVIGA